jgi:triosephosphate isomerase
MHTYIFLNLKRFDITPALGGVNRIARAPEWGTVIASEIVARLATRGYLDTRYRFVAFFPEAHLIPAVSGALDSKLEIGCQSVHWADTAVGGNFGAFTTERTANSMSQIGCTWTIIGHSEERRDLAETMRCGGAPSEHIATAVGMLLNKKIRCARAAGLNVLYCIGENADEVNQREAVLEHQIALGLDGIDLNNMVLAYEPVWAIGPGKTPPSASQIAQTASIVKRLCPAPLVYGGGLKQENSSAIAAIPDVDGGLIALTRFSGEIGFYPQEYIEIVDRYAQGLQR